jgi:hypothetical protein
MDATPAVKDSTSIAGDSGGTAAAVVSTGARAGGEDVASAAAAASAARFASFSAFSFSTRFSVSFWWSNSPPSFNLIASFLLGLAGSIGNAPTFD